MHERARLTKNKYSTKKNVQNKKIVIHNDSNDTQTYKNQITIACEIYYSATRLYSLLCNVNSPGHSFEPPLGSSSPETASRSQFRPANNITSQLLHASTVIFPCDSLLPTMSNDGLAYRRYSMLGESWYVHIRPTLLAVAAIAAGHSGVSLSQIPVAG